MFEVQKWSVGGKEDFFNCDNDEIWYIKGDLADNVEEIGGSWGEARHEVPRGMRWGEIGEKIFENYSMGDEKVAAGVLASK